jgi:hypothetical protein
MLIALKSYSLTVAKWDNFLESAGCFVLEIDGHFVQKCTDFIQIFLTCLKSVAKLSLHGKTAPDVAKSSHKDTGHGDHISCMLQYISHLLSQLYNKYPKQVQFMAFCISSVSPLVHADTLTLNEVKVYTYGNQWLQFINIEKMTQKNLTEHLLSLCKLI